MREDLSVHHVALALLAGLVHGLREEGAPWAKCPSTGAPPGPPSSALTCVSLTVALLGARGLVRVTVYRITLLWSPLSSFFQGWKMMSGGRQGRREPAPQKGSLWLCPVGPIVPGAGATYGGCSQHWRDCGQGLGAGGRASPRRPLCDLCCALPLSHSPGGDRAGALPPPSPAEAGKLGLGQGPAGSKEGLGRDPLRRTVTEAGAAGNTRSEAWGAARVLVRPLTEQEVWGSGPQSGACSPEGGARWGWGEEEKGEEGEEDEEEEGEEADEEEEGEEEEDEEE